MQIAQHQLVNNLILAPMAGVTDKPFRTLCRRMGAAMAVSEMISANASTWGTLKSLRRLDHQDEPGPISVQILGADPAAMAEAARINVGYGAEIIDINMGCPAKKVCKTAAGSALLRDETRVARILEAVVKAVEVPVTLKIRTGWDQQNRNAVNIAHIAQNSGIQALAIHGRTKACGYKGEAEYQTIAAVKQLVNIPVIANGDIQTPQQAKQVLEQTGADGLMIGRAAQGRPWIFNEIAHFLNTGETKPPRASDEIKAILMEHLHALYEFYGMEKGIKIARKHIGWYSKGLTGGALFRAAINQAGSAEEQQALIHHFFAAGPIPAEIAA